MINMKKKIFIFFSKLILKRFYDQKYLKGKWFEDDVTGWKWGWKCLIDQKIKGYNRHVNFPVNPTTTVGNVNNIEFCLDNMDNFWKTGCYYQSWNGKISIGKGTWIAQNVGLITENHNIYDLSKHMDSEDIVIGEKCWLGMNSIILPGVILGNNTVVAAGAVVTKSFPEGKCILAGVPAKIIKKL